MLEREKKIPKKGLFGWRAVGTLVGARTHSYEPQSPLLSRFFTMKSDNKLLDNTMKRRIEKGDERERERERERARERE